MTAVDAAVAVARLALRLAATAMWFAGDTRYLESPAFQRGQA